MHCYLCVCAAAAHSEGIRRPCSRETSVLQPGQRLYLFGGIWSGSWALQVRKLQPTLGLSMFPLLGHKHSVIVFILSPYILRGPMVKSPNSSLLHVEKHFFFSNYWTGWNCSDLGRTSRVKGELTEQTPPCFIISLSKYCHQEWSVGCGVKRLN